MRPLLRAAANIVLALAAIAVSLALFKFVLMPALDRLVDPHAAATTFVRRTGTALSILFGYWAFVRLREKRQPNELRPSLLGIALGVFSGAALISLTTLALFALGAYQVTAYRGWQDALPDVAGVILVAAILEEVVFRGVMFRLLEPTLGIAPAAIVTALVFGVVHLPNLNGDVGTAAMLTTFVSVALIGGFWTLLYARTRNLWFVTFHHAAWNFSIVLSGATLSGLDEWRAAAPIASSDHGPAWLTGGVFGPEDSIVTIVAVSLALVWLWRSMQRGSAKAGNLQTRAQHTDAHRVVALRDTASRLTELWSPRIVAAVDDNYVKLCKVQGTFGWHSHSTDELFIVLRGTLSIAIEDSHVVLSEGDCYVVPRGVRHNPSAPEECLLMLFEHKSTLHAESEHDAAVPLRSIAEQLRPI
jgi:hypothetical protein